MKILVACEYSQIVTSAFLAQGHDVFSCDILPCEGNYPERHLQCNVTPLLIQNWDLILAFPPCTDLSVCGARFFKRKRISGYQQKSIDFFMLFALNPCPRICIENPPGIMSTYWRKPDQIIKPWLFGDTSHKQICLWLKGLPPLLPCKIVDPVFIYYNSKKTFSGKSRYSELGKLGSGKGKERSIFYPGIAHAMAEQWSQNFITLEGRNYDVMSGT